MMNNRVFAYALIVLFSLLAVKTNAEDCKQGEEEVIFVFHLDEDSLTENGWSMQCDEKVIWNVAPGSLNDMSLRLRRKYPFIRRTACIPEASTCTFTIEDTYGDGLLYPGYYYLSFGPFTIHTYDRKPFHEQSFCFGANCPEVGQEIAQDYDDLYFYFKLDANPEESAYNITCGDEHNVILEGSGFTEADAYREIEIETVVEPYACCNLTLYDAGNDGLGDQEPGFHGNVVYLDWATHQILKYESDVEFGMIRVKFGIGC